MSCKKSPIATVLAPLAQVSLAQRRVTVSVPATVANLGPGLEVVGMAAGSKKRTFSWFVREDLDSNTWPAGVFFFLSLRTIALPQRAL